ncbi:unnamed protein product (macronuclear) [Paramecium tetraurelia]|uniref:Uncharacterized protein n=1 Tax=Paramecium tetraurelia TaxID=5888 RepID=A0D354_PARTE|nr:uncharacterized protein GSPATT00012956001 [Paramecium tetraurelia]CAK77471.1 unnamed protein product [Paramecium tetraurelia]|eukprot:XP_001444868.1 hypothetical protein (macronuclear) [Paramecium tetraurelia strain d4-2]
MNFNQQVYPAQIKSQKSLNSQHQNSKDSNKRSILNTPLLSKHPKTNRIHTLDDLNNKEKFLDLKNLRTPITKQISLDTEPQYFQGKRASDIDKANFLQIQTARTMRSSQIDRNNTMKTQAIQQIPTEQRNKNYFKRESISNDKILDLLLMNTQQLKGFFQKEKEPSQRAKPRINNAKGFPSDFFSIL